MSAFDIDRLSTVVYTSSCKILYTSFKNTQDINKTFMNVDRNALNTYIALYSYATSASNHRMNSTGDNNKADESNVDIVSASIKNKRKLLIGHYKDTYITILISDMIKFYELEVLKKGIRRILLCMDFYKTFDHEYDLKEFVENTLKEVDIYKYFHKFDNFKKQIINKDNHLLIYDSTNREIVFSSIGKSLETLLLNWIDYKSSHKLNKSFSEVFRSEFFPSLGHQEEMSENILNKTYNHLRMPFQYTYEVLNEIIGINTENVANLMLENETVDENIKIKNTHFVNKVFKINDEKHLFWVNEGYVAFMKVDDIEMSILKEYDDMIIDRVNEYESRNKTLEHKNFHYIIKRVEEEALIYTNFNVNEGHEEERKWTLWPTRTSKNIENLSNIQYKSLYNHLLTIVMKECDYEVKERMIKLKDYDPSDISKCD
ncbi:unnamed protein product [Hanseniaspora opuntiae]